jgi:CelD/BcsL family acetyltransferase involved in cellulose biosynthesis
MQRLTTTMIETEPELEALVSDWTALWQRLAATTPFQSPAWLLAWWRAFHPGKLMVTAVHLDGRLVGLAPCYLEEDAGRMRLLPVGASISDYLDLLVDPELASSVLPAISAAYADSAVPWSAWELPELSPSAAALGLPVPAVCTRTMAQTVPCPVLELASTRSEPADLSFVPSPMRRKYRMACHRLARHGAARILRTPERDTIWWVRELSRLHGARWQARGEPGVFGDRRLASFHASAIDGLAEHNLVRLYALLLGEQVVGIYYGFLDRGRAYAYLGGFDPQFQYYSPGTALVGAAILEATAAGVSEFHFLRGREDYKYRWGAIDRMNTRLTIFRGADDR